MRLLVLVPFLLALAGCGSVLPEPSSPRLFTLSAMPAADESLPRLESHLLVQRPLASQGLGGRRIALRTSPTTVDYVADAEWTDVTPDLLQTMMLDTFERSGVFQGVGREGQGFRADVIVRSDLRDFHAVYPGDVSAVPVVHVGISAMVVSARSREVVAQRLFEARVPATANNMDSIIAAFDAAVSGILRDLVAWTARAAERI